MPQRPIVRRKKKARRTKKLIAWKLKQAEQAAQDGASHRSDTKTKKSDES